ncbi:DNA-binding response regulator [Nibricoccus aquaticus]|uniref:DNA-binding response regulator n=1 Tax=Nibricoccus aquaticus TaxID=2576891 RepID=A0A290QIM5_9BACT|nr:LytTR family DNA-binding domain-containing protein [Nibricoccus aquaticus]ATC64191.1 DNA-binding response regulator [Nibricoccus aquaticus]
MKTLRALLIDDERLARQELAALLKVFPWIEVVGEAGNATQALKLVEELKPELLFLDVEMPGRDGFSLLGALPEPRPRVIFTTAHDQFAVKAFEVEAVDYLLKPVHPKRLAAALAKLRNVEKREKVEEEGTDMNGRGEGVLAEDDRVLVREGERCWFVPVKSIRLLEAEGNHTRVHFQNERPLLYRTLTAMEARLPEKIFLRANRSQLVNVNFIETAGAWFSGSMKVALRGGPEVEFSRRQAQIFRERMSL